MNSLLKPELTAFWRRMSNNGFINNNLISETIKVFQGVIVVEEGLKLIHTNDQINTIAIIIYFSLCPKFHRHNLSRF